MSSNDEPVSFLQPTAKSFEPAISRTIVFVRHGQYIREPAEQLTILGAEQARLTATALEDLEIHKMFSSTMPRAKQTASIISKKLGLSCSANDLYCEASLPAPPFFFKGDWIPDRSRKGIAALKKRMEVNKVRADEAFDTLFKQPNKGQSVHLVVAHGNIIAYWVGRALKMNPLNWLNLEIQQCSITTLRVDDSARIKLLGFSEVGHIPRSKRSYM